MSTIVLDPPTPSTKLGVRESGVSYENSGTQRRLFTKDEYYRLSEQGFFTNQRVQLLGGEIVVYGVQCNWHAASIEATRRSLGEAFGPNYWVRNQCSLDLSPVSVPDPDLAVVEGSRTVVERANPTTAILVVEVSETTLHEDRGRKVGIYAAAGIAEYWIVNIRDLRLEVRTRPQADPSHEFGFHYANLATLEADEFASPLALPGVKIPVVDLLPMVLSSN